MKKLINAVEDVVSESLAGFCAAHSDIVRLGDEAPFVQRRISSPARWRWCQAAAPDTSRSTPDLSDTACWTRHVPVRSLPRRRPISFSPLPRR